LPAAALLAAAIALMPARSLAVQYELWAKPGTVSMPDATVNVWGYAMSAAGAVSVPGPRLVVPPGDTTLSIILHNSLPEATSIVIPGLPATLSPVFVNDAQGRRRVKSFTTETPSTGTATYTWTGVKPGTYLYQSGSIPGKQVPMGLYGAVTQDAADGMAYANVAYGSEVMLFFSELDPVLGTNPDVTRPVTYNPRYFLVNGQPFVQGDPSATLAAGATNQAVLVRMLNAGLESHGAKLLGSHMQVVAEDGNAYPYSHTQYVAYLPPGKTKDAIWVPSSSGVYPVLDAFHYMTNNGNVGGGFLRYLSVTEPAAPPVATADAYSTQEDTLLTVAAPGVLANDTATGTPAVALVTTVAHGTLALNADGSFSYTPAANYYGPDQFTYRAQVGTQYSAPAAVAITVSSVADPVSAAADSASTPLNTAVTINILANDSNPDGNPPVVVTPAVNGAAVVNADNTVTYTPNANFTGTDSFVYQLSGTNTSTATVTVTVSNPPAVNQPPVAADDIVQTPRSTPVVIAVLLNDADPDGSLVPSSVRLAGGVTSLSTPQGGAATVNATGTIQYTPRNGFRGSDTFTYTVRDNAGATSNAATVRVDVVR
jgi:hypothetical protein